MNSRSKEVEQLPHIIHTIKADVEANNATDPEELGQLTAARRVRTVDLPVAAEALDLPTDLADPVFRRFVQGAGVRPDHPELQPDAQRMLHLV